MNQKELQEQLKKDDKTGFVTKRGVIRLTRKQERLHDRSYRLWLIRRGVIRPRGEAVH